MVAWGGVELLPLPLSRFAAESSHARARVLAQARWVLRVHAYECDLCTHACDMCTHACDM